VKPPNAPKEPVASTLHLTKKEMKRQRKLRRAEKQRELQDMQAAGLIPAPEPKLTLSNFMKVLGDQAIMDPSKMEAKVMEQIQARKMKHEKMNAERKLTKEQRAEKRDKKLLEDTSHAVSVALFCVKDLSHRYHRTKVDLNAQQNKITGGVLECQCPSLSLVICEGGPKAIKRFTRLMTVRMNWTGEGILNTNDDDGDDDVMVTSATMEDEQGITGDMSTTQKFNPENSCELVWTGMAPKRMFRTFVFQDCETSEDARRILEAKGVAHFWDQVLVHASGSGETFNFKLGIDA
jgi:U4/U6 small nuclear ribonucleoprotein PRP3